jgi:hypothetical protein
MTYPPQPEQSGQPDPNQPGGYSQTGGFGQQGQPYGGQYPQQYPQPGGYEQQQYPQPGGYEQQQYPQPGGYEQQQYPQTAGYEQQQYPPPGGYQQQYPANTQYGPGFGGAPVPPKKSNTGLVVGIALAVVAVVAIGVTGFIAPGFFLGKASDKTASAAASSSAPAVPPAAGSSPPSTDSTDDGSTGSTGDTGDIDPAAKAEVDKFMTALNNKDADGAYATRCDDAIVTKDDITQAATKAPGYKVSTYDGSGASVGVVSAVIEGPDGTTTGGLTVSKTPDGSSYCLSTLFLIS